MPEDGTFSLEEEFQRAGSVSSASGTSIPRTEPSLLWKKSSRG